MYFRSRSPLAVMSTVGACLLLAACGGSSSKATATQEQEEKFVKFAKCLREHGINATTPSGSGKGELRVTGINPQTMEAAQKACKAYQPSGEKQNLTPQQKVEREEAVMKFAKCMREHGIDVHASTSGGAIRIQSHIGAGERGPNPESPAFQTAQKACSGLLPNKGPGPGARIPSGEPGGGPSTNTAKPGSGNSAGFAIGG
jgi:pyruvate/2-oxoglutarate dehydrogenase complex dihydrolipoamide acyltransferase (E2) component